MATQTDYELEPGEEQKLKDALWRAFTPMFGHKLVDEEPEFDGKYVTLILDTLRNPSGEGDFHLSFFQAEGEEDWRLVDYEAKGMMQRDEA